jgi:hypothetical protein
MEPDEKDAQPSGGVLSLILPALFTASPDGEASHWKKAKSSLCFAGKINVVNS